MTTIIRRLIAGAALVATLAGAAAPDGCKPPPEPGSITVLGDSVTEQAHGYLHGWQGAPSTDVLKIAGSGWSVANVQPRFDADVASGRPEAAVVALGPNDAAEHTGWWQLNDLAAWDRLLRSPHPSTCLVIILPGHHYPAGSRQAIELDQAHAHIEDMATPGGLFPPPPSPTVVLDWQQAVDDDPTLLYADGIHLSGERAAEVRQAMYWRGVRACPG